MPKTRTERKEDRKADERFAAKHGTPAHAKTKTIDITPNYANLVRKFGDDAISMMNVLARRGGNLVDFEELYRILHSVRMVLSAYHDGNDDVKRAFIDFREKYQATGDKLYDKLQQLQRAKHEGNDEEGGS
jgi:hypothetical protein